MYFRVFRDPKRFLPFLQSEICFLSRFYCKADNGHAVTTILVFIVVFVICAVLDSFSLFCLFEYTGFFYETQS